MYFTIAWFVIWGIGGFPSFLNGMNASDPHTWSGWYLLLFGCLFADVIRWGIKKKKGD